MSRLARYETKVHPSNRHSGYGIDVTVYAANRADAVQRAIDIGWIGNQRDALVTVIRVDDVLPTPDPEKGTEHE